VLAWDILEYKIEDEKIKWGIEPSLNIKEEIYE